MTVPLIGGPFAGQRHANVGDLVELPWYIEDCPGLLCGEPGSAHGMAAQYRLERTERVVRGHVTVASRYLFVGLRCLDGTVPDGQLTPASLAAAVGLVVPVPRPAR